MDQSTERGRDDERTTRCRARGVKGAWIGGGFNHTGKKAQRTNNPKLFLPADTLWSSALGYDWKWENRPMSAVVNWQNMGDVDYFPANQQRGLPGRAVFSLTTKF